MILQAMDMTNDHLRQSTIKARTAEVRREAFAGGILVQKTPAFMRNAVTRQDELSQPFDEEQMEHQSYSCGNTI